MTRPNQIVHLLLLLLLHNACGPTAFAQTASIKEVQLQYDTTALLELFNEVQIGLRVYYQNGNQESTEGLLRGRLRWQRWEITSSQGTVRNGILHFDRQAARQNHHQVTLQVKSLEAPPFCTSLQLPIPYLKKIRFNLYTDSLKPGIHFYLNVEGQFNTGKIYPLEASNLRFEHSTGLIIGQDLLLEKKDAASVKTIRVKVIYLPDPHLQDEISIPVKKALANESLPTEEEILHQAKKKKKGLRSGS